MNSVILTENDLISENLYQLSTEASLHLKEIVKVKEGETLKATLLNKSLATCEIVEVSEQIKLKVLETKPGKSYPLHFIIGASRPPTMKKVLEHGSSLGVSHFHIVKGELSEKSYLQSKLYQNENYKEFTRLGISQSAVFHNDPTLEVAQYQNQLSLPETSQKYILSPYADKHVKDIEIDLSQDSIFAVGPERGWTDQEVQNYKDRGYTEIKISPSILRVEIASFALLGYLNQLMD